MSDLAFNIHGERFEPPTEAMGWRVRRLKPGGRGMPDVVFGEDGAPLMIDMDTELVEFRRLVGAEPGRYRLDPVDEDGKPVDGGAPSYLHMKSATEATPAAHAQAASSSAELEVIRELVKVNSEMVRAIADKFATVMDSAATLIRAADGAGMPARTPAALEQELPSAAALDDDEEDDDEELRNAPTSEFGQIIAQIAPLVQLALAGRNQAPAAPATRNAAPEDSANDDDEDTDDEPEAPAALTREQMAHVVAVQMQLSPKERRLAEAMAKELTPGDLRAWVERLTALSVDGAAGLIRETIASSSVGDAS